MGTGTVAPHHCDGGGNSIQLYNANCTERTANYDSPHIDQSTFDMVRNPGITADDSECDLELSARGFEKEKDSGVGGSSPRASTYETMNQLMRCIFSLQWASPSDPQPPSPASIQASA